MNTIVCLHWISASLKEICSYIVPYFFYKSSEQDAWNLFKILCGTHAAQMVKKFSYQKDSDKYGDHAIVCGSHGERIARHNQLRDAIYQVAASSNLAPRKEENALLPGTSARSADVLIPQWTGSTKQNQGDMFAGTMTHFHLVQLQPEHQDLQDQHLRQD